MPGTLYLCATPIGNLGGYDTAGGGDPADGGCDRGGGYP